MKGCFVLQRRFAQIGHELAVLLKEKHGISDFCAYVHMRESFQELQKQRDISYSSMILDEDIQKRYKDESLDLEYLKEIEREYGNVWSFIGADRVVRYGQFVREYPHDTSAYTYKEMLRMVQVFVKEFTKFFDREKPDFIVAYLPGALGTALFYAMAEKRGIPILSIFIPNTRETAVISSKYNRLSWVEEIYKSNLGKGLAHVPHYEEAKKCIEEFREKPGVYSKVYTHIPHAGKSRRFDFLHPRNLYRTVMWVYRMYRDWNRNPEKKTDYTSVHPTYYFIDTIKRKARNLFRAINYDAYDLKPPYVYYPLHLEPELAILVMAPFETDQIGVVRRLAQSLPVGMYVYVKEHPQMAPYRPSSFYQQLKKIPNVKLLHPKTSSFDLIKNSRLVATIAGSPGWEALFLGKPVITFGRVFYNALPSVAHSLIPEELPQLVQKQLHHQPSDEDIIRYLAAIFEDGARCDLYYLWEKVDSGENKRKELVELADVLARKIAIMTGEL